MGVCQGMHSAHIRPASSRRWVVEFGCLAAWCVLGFCSVFFGGETLSFSKAAFENARVLADFEQGVPVSSFVQPGFRPRDAKIAMILERESPVGGKFARFLIGSDHRDLFFQYAVRWRYLVNGTALYRELPLNCLTFTLRVRNGSPLIDVGKNTLGVWTYHWAPGDRWVGGKNGRSGTTDSMMHGYANMRLLPGAEGRWVRVELSPSAFRHQREYYHFYAARAVSGELDFFSSLRQLQFRVLANVGNITPLDIDNMAVVRKEATAIFEPDYVAREVPSSEAEVRVPIVLINPTNRARRYRVFISSFLGTSRSELNRAFGEADSVGAPTAVQKAVGGDGGLGVAYLADAKGEPAGYREIGVAAGGKWKGFLVHRLRPEMLGPSVTVRYRGRKWAVRRDTLTTSVIAWDPDEPSAPGMEWIRVAPSNADDGQHRPPPGFPPQERPPEGWRSEDVPPDQVAAYLVTEITLR